LLASAQQHTQQLLVVRAGFVAQFGQYVRGVLAARCCEALKLFHVTLFGGEFHELVHGIPAAAVREATQFFEVPSFRGTFNQFVDCIAVTAGSPFTQSREFGV
jgi:hypothetical protein